MEKVKKQLSQAAETLLDLLGFKAKITLTAEDDGWRLELSLPEQEAGGLIGYHGETIASLQLILGLILYRQTGEWQKLTVDVGEYRKKRAEYLTELAKDTADKVAESNEPLALYSLNPFERRTVHLALAGDKRVITESQGEGRNRFLVVSPAGQSQV